MNDKSESKNVLIKGIKKTFIGMGVLPFFIILAIIIFTILSDNFLTVRNLINVSRQTTYLVIVAMGQMFALITGGFDLSVGTMLSLSSVVGALAMSAMYAAFPEAVALVVFVGLLAGLLAGLSVGIINGIGISVFNINPFMMTLGMASVGFGVALFLTGGVPVYGMPESFGNIFGFGKFMEIPTPVIITVGLIIIVYFLVNWTKIGRYFYAVGGNIKASSLSGINTKYVLFLSYVFCSFLATISGLLMTARLETGEANIGVSMPLESIAACVIGGISLRGGVGRVEGAVLGALFIGLIQNGMNLSKIDSYLQTVVIGILLILAVAFDQFRQHLAAKSKD